MIELDSTVLCALIGAVSALVGAFIGTHSSAKSTTKLLEAADRQQRYKEKVSAYSDFLAAYQRFILTTKTDKTWDVLNEFTDQEITEGISFASAYTRACLLAPADVRKMLHDVYVHTVKCADGVFSSSELSVKYGALVEVLHWDLEGKKPLKQDSQKKEHS